MLDITIHPNLIERQIEECFKRIEHSDDPQYRVSEANNAWFQLFGMRKIIEQGGALRFNLQTSQNAEEQREYQRILSSLDAALEKVEALYEEVHQGKPK